MKPIRKTTLLNIFILLALLVSQAHTPTMVQAQSPTPGKPLEIYMFYGEGCPHCALAKPYFESLPESFPGVSVHIFEVYYNEDNQQLFISMANLYGVEQLAVPTFFIGPYPLQGYAEYLIPDIERVIEQCLEVGCADAGEGLITPLLEPSPTAIPPTPTTTPMQATATPTPILTPTPSENPFDSTNLNIPLVGNVDLALKSNLLSTVLIALVDGFNPCSIWVLSMLLALTLHTGSRKKVFLIGIVFLTVTAGIYALFIVGLFSVLKVTSFLGWIRVVVAIIALAIALINIKDYFWYKEGVSLSIADEKKPGIFKRMRKVMDASQSVWGLIGTTIVLAAGVSMVEFSCTAGLPVVWVNLLNAQNVSGAAFLLLLLVYMLIYQVDEMVIFFSAVVSLKASRLEEKHGRILKLISGMLMLTLSLVMLINPAMMNDIGSSLIIFGSVIVATLLILLVHRVILPKFGIKIGSEPDANPDSEKLKESK